MARHSLRTLSDGLRLAGLLLRDRVPAQFVLQLTDACNAHCPQCGMRAKAEFPRSRLDREALRAGIDRVAALGGQVLSFTGGEPLLYLDDLCDALGYARDRGIRFTRTGTNGFLFRGSDAPYFDQRMAALAQRLAATGLRNFWISLDSADAARHEAIRGLPGVVEGVRRALPIFHRHGLYPAANLGINRHLGGDPPPCALTPEALERFYADGFRRFLQQVHDLGFTTVNVCYPMSCDDADTPSLYRAVSSDDIVRFTAGERRSLYRALRSVIPAFRDRLRIFTPLSALSAMIRQQEGDLEEVAHCRGGVDFFYVSAGDGHVYPCGYRAQDDLGPLQDFQLPRHAQPECRACDWECFRDPSEVLAPLVALGRPWRLLGRVLRDPRALALWWRDLGYVRACGWFDGRRPPEPARLARFGDRRPGAGRTVKSPTR